MNICSIEELPHRLGFAGFKLDFPTESLGKPLTQFKMEVEDASILRYIYRNKRPHRHLEFGTWEGAGTLLALENSDATVWTLNLYEGELKTDGSWAYGRKFQDGESAPLAARKAVFDVEEPDVAEPSTAEKLLGTHLGRRLIESANKKLGVSIQTNKKGMRQDTYYQTDSFGFIGRRFLSAGFGHRVCQIYCDTRDWDTSNYPAGFFDTILIDGGHTEEVVISDTRKALPLLAPGGIMMWHDYCPDPEVLTNCTSPVGVVKGLDSIEKEISDQFKDLFWVKPSWLALGIKR